MASTAWSADDLALLDEAAFLIGGRTRTYGHIVVDEAQDLTPMQFRMVARRAPSGSITVLGDLAQATGPWTYSDWAEVRAHLPETAPLHHDELTLGYRAPGLVLDYASRLLPVAAPGVGPTSSIRSGRTEPAVRAVPPEELAAAALAEARTLAEDHALVAVIAPDELVPSLARVSRRHAEVGILERDAMTPPHHDRPGTGGQGPRVRRGRRRRACRDRRRRPPGPATALRGHDPSDPTSERACTPSPCPPRSAS